MGLLNNNDFKEVKKANSERKSAIMEQAKEVKKAKFNSLLMYDAINRYYSLKEILEDIGVTDLGATNCCCPFHGEIKGLSKPSAKYYPDSDTLYCYQEGKSYTAYHGIKILWNGDIKIYFNEAWNNLNDVIKEELLQKYGDVNSVEKSDNQLEPYSDVYNEFISGNINFKTYRTALRKVLYEIYTTDREKTLKEIFKKKE